MFLVPLVRIQIILHTNFQISV